MDLMMKILDLLIEAKFSDGIYVYHGSFLKHLRSIIKKGLVANHSMGGYGSMGSDDMGVPLTSLNGVYVTKSYMMALDAASSLNNVKQELVVVCKVQPRSFVMDEDNIDSVFRTRTIRVHTREKIKEDEGFLVDNAAHKALADELWKDEFIYVIKESIASSKIKYIEKPAIEYITSIITLTCLNKLWELDPDNSQLEQNSRNYHKIFKEKQNNLTKALRHIKSNDKSPYGFQSFRIESDIGFSGANRIVGIIYPYLGYVWGDYKGSGIQSDIKRIFDTPIELLKNIEKDINNGTV